MLALALLACHGHDDTVAHTGDDDDTVAHHTGPGTTGETGHTGTARDPRDVLYEGFLWGYPLVFSMRTSHERPYNSMNWNPRRPDETADHVPNPDILYGLANLDLNVEPVVVHTTTLTDRYWVMQFSDMYTETFSYLGTRATAGQGGDYLLTAPGWSGTVPVGYTQIEAPTARVALLGRIHVIDDADVPNAARLISGYWALPQSVVEQGGTPADVEAWPWCADLATDGVFCPESSRDLTGYDGIEFWDELSLAMQLSPPRPEEQWVADELEPFGIGPGRTPSLQVTDPEIRALLDSIPPEGADDVLAATAQYKNWVPQLGLGRFEGDFLTRAAWARDGWLTQEQDEAVYARTAPMQPGLYVLHFAPDAFPPAWAFWSITAYTEDGHLVENPIPGVDQFSLQSSDPAIEYNPDRSMDIWFSPTYPGHSNWLAIPPSAPFSATLRTYMPEDPILDGSWQPPALQPQ